MNAIAHGVVDALACATKNGSVPRTVHAKRREGKGPHRTTPEYLFVETEHHVVQLGDVVVARDAMMRCAEEPS